jgi:hypothetical protein
MKNKLMIFALVCCVFTSFVGCVRTLDERVHGGMPFKKDSIEGRYDRSVAQLFDTAKVVLTREGTIVGENTISKVLEANVNNNRVWVKVEEVEPKVTRIVVQARDRYSNGNIELAAQIKEKIALALVNAR